MKQKPFVIESTGSLIEGELWKGSRKTIVLIQGLTGTRHSMDTIARYLNEKKHQVITYDLRGRGRSIPGHQSRCNLIEHIEDLKRILEFFQFQDAVLIGHSYGSMIALRFYERYPTMVRGMILLDGGFLKNPAQAIPVWNALKEIKKIHEKHFETVFAYYETLKKAGIHLKDYGMVSEYLETEVEKTKYGYQTRLRPETLEMEMNYLGLATTYRGWFQILKNPLIYFLRTRKRLKFPYESIKVPVLIVKTGKPPGRKIMSKSVEFLPLDTLGEMIVRIPHVESVIVATDHFNMLFHKNELMMKSMRRFLSNMNEQ